MEKVKGRYLKTEWDDELLRRFTALLRTVVTRHMVKGSPIGDRRREARALVVVGEAGTGKTESLNRLFLTHPSLPGYGQLGSRCPLATVTVPAPCTLKTLGMGILQALGYPLARDLKEHLIWARIHEQLPRAGVLLLHLDEMHNLTDGANVGQLANIRKALKGLMVSREWPVGLIISGLPGLVPEMQEIDEIRRRGRFLRVPLLNLPDDLELVEKVIKGLATIGGLEVREDVDSSMAPRLIHAALYRFGVMVELLHEAIELAVSTGAPLDSEHFAIAYTDRTGCSAPMNPFVAANWADLDCSLVLVNESSRVPSLSDDLPKGSKMRRTQRKRGTER
ncbi:ATP-binding protein [Microvirga sp. c23x22]|uniref:ATP-binding protein n=2 Tax=Microvirga terricola TaxID=2719797 RepID=A0ABX0VGS7_9HYPH|nr:ATP-binding protein [Microvirga terricola]